jgi:hypothetical protein
MTVFFVQDTHFVSTLQRNVANGVGKQNHDENKAGCHWPQVNPSSKPEKVTIEIGQHEHHRYHTEQ